jgi:hypothetical protein
VKSKPFTFAELQTVTSLGRGEIRECINRGIISAPAGVGQGHHRAYSKWNLVEGVIAAALLRHVRAGSVAVVMTRLRLMLRALHIEPETYCMASDQSAFFDFTVFFPPRARPDDKADLAFGEDIGADAFVIATASAISRPHDRLGLNSETRSEPFCALSADLAKAVLFVNHMIETKLGDSPSGQ